MSRTHQTLNALDLLRRAQVLLSLLDGMREENNIGGNALPGELYQETIGELGVMLAETLEDAEEPLRQRATPCASCQVILQSQWFLGVRAS